MPAYRLSDQLRDLGAVERSRPAVVHASRTLTFGEVDDRADRFARGLRAAGLGVGDRVGILMPNLPEHVEVLLGTARAGAVVVPLNWRLATAELAAVVADAGIAAFVVDPSTAHLHDALAAAGRPRLVLTRGADYEAWLAAVPGTTSTALLLDDPRRVVLQVYTSGTSGAPKGVLLTDGNLDAKVPSVAPWWGVTDRSRTMLATPLFHVGGLSWLLVGLHARATTVIASDAAAETLLAHLADDRITHTFLVPAMIQRLCDAVAGGLALPALMSVMYGASPISAQTQQAAYELFGPVLHQLYGLSETTGAFTEMRAQHDLVPSSPRWRSAGRPYPWVEVEVRDPETGRRCTPGEFGEVWTRSGQNTLGYHGRAEETADLLTPDGWLRTGDGGHLDEEGHLFLTDRIKDLIISGGENVYPAEVEQVLRRHVAVADAAVVGVPDARWGESVGAAVVLHPRVSATAVVGVPDARWGESVGAAVVLHPRVSATADELISWAGDRLAGYKRPRRLLVLEDLPRNATGKVLRRHLRDRFGAPADPPRPLSPTTAQEVR